MPSGKAANPVFPPTGSLSLPTRLPATHLAGLLFHAQLNSNSFCSFPEELMTHTFMWVSEFFISLWASNYMVSYLCLKSVSLGRFWAPWGRSKSHLCTYPWPQLSARPWWVFSKCFAGGIIRPDGASSLKRTIETGISGPTAPGRKGSDSVLRISKWGAEASAAVKALGVAKGKGCVSTQVPRLSLLLGEWYPSGQPPPSCLLVIVLGFVYPAPLDA